MDLKHENRREGFSEDHFKEQEYSKGDLFIAKESFFEEDFDEEEMAESAEEVPSWGVYLQGKEKTLLGLFWDEELAQLFLSAIQHSKALEKVKEIA